jgi:hypothetical protein
MGKLEKLVEQFLNKPPEVRFEDVRYLLEAFGFEEKGLRVATIVFEIHKVEKLLYPKKADRRLREFMSSKLLSY